METKNFKKINTLFSRDQIQKIEDLSEHVSKSDIARTAMSIGLMQLETKLTQEGELALINHCKLMKEVI